MALQIRRGLENERTAGGGVVFAEGELVYVTDTDALYVGDGSTAGGVKLTDNAGAVLGSYITADTVSSTLDLQQNLDLNGKDIIGTGNINIAGTINATGNVNIGDDVNTDTVDFAAKITSSLTPNADATYDLGTTLLKWNNIHAVRLDGDVEGSVFADDSGLLVDGVAGKIVGDIKTASLRTSESKIALGEDAGQTSQGSSSVAIGSGAGQTTQGYNSVALGWSAGATTQGNNAVALGRRAQFTGGGDGAVGIGYNAGYTGQGASAVAIGYDAGRTNQAANSIVLNATGSQLDNITASSLVIKPVRDAVGTTAVMYNATTGEVTHTATPAFNLQGNLTGDVTGNVTGSVKGSGGSAVLAPNAGPADAVLSILDITATGTIGGNLTGNVTGDAAGDHTGTFAGVITATGTFDGDITGSVFGDDSTLIVDAINKTLIGNVTGNVTGDTAGVHTGNIFTNLIDSADSSAIIVTPVFQVESDLIASNALIVGTGNVAGPGGPNVILKNTGEILANTITASSIGAGSAAVEFNVISKLGLKERAAFEKAASFQDAVSIQTIAGAFTGSFAVETFTGDPESDAEIADVSNYNKHFEATTTKVSFGVPAQMAVVADDSARGTLVPSPAAGMMLFMTAGSAPSATTQLQVYNGSAWVNV